MTDLPDVLCQTQIALFLLLLKINVDSYLNFDKTTWLGVPSAQYHVHGVLLQPPPPFSRTWDQQQSLMWTFDCVAKQVSWQRSFLSSCCVSWINKACNAPVIHQDPVSVLSSASVLNLNVSGVECCQHLPRAWVHCTPNSYIFVVNTSLNFDSFNIVLSFPPRLVLTES